MELHCGLCLLRPFRPSDAPSLARHADNRKIWLNLRDRFPHPYRLEDAERFIAMVQGTDATSFAIEVDGAAVGGLGLQPGEDVERCSAELGYWLGEPYWGRGITTAAVRAVTEHAFTTLRLARVFALPYTRNPASVRVLEKAGYQREGLLRCSAIKDGDLLDQYVYAAVRAISR